MLATARVLASLGILAALLATSSAQALPEGPALPGGDAPLATTSLLEPTSILPPPDPSPDSSGEGGLVPSGPAPTPPLPGPDEENLGGLLGGEEPAPANQTGPGEEDSDQDPTAPGHGTSPSANGSNKTGGPTKGAPPIGGRGSANVGGTDAGVNAAVGADGTAPEPARANASTAGGPATAGPLLIPGLESFLLVAAVAIGVMVLIARRSE